MNDIRLIVFDDSREIFASEFLKMQELPFIGHFIKTNYFIDKCSIINRLSKTCEISFEVIKIEHVYVDDMSGIDYTTITLKLVWKMKF